MPYIPSSAHVYMHTHRTSHILHAHVHMHARGILIIIVLNHLMLRIRQQQQLTTGEL